MSLSTVSRASSLYEKPVGRKELLKWCSDISGASCHRLEDLRDGTVILRIMSKIWPLVVDPRVLKWKPNPRTQEDIIANWNIIRNCMLELKLPMEVYDRKAIMAGKFKQCYTFLVMLFFLQNLSENHDFSVDFAHPIDGKLAAFLQSTESVECLARGGGLRLEDIPQRDWQDDQSDVSFISNISQQTNFSRPESVASSIMYQSEDGSMRHQGGPALTGRYDARSYYGSGPANIPHTQQQQNQQQNQHHQASPGEHEALKDHTDSYSSGPYLYQGSTNTAHSGSTQGGTSQGRHTMDQLNSPSRSATSSSMSSFSFMTGASSSAYTIDKDFDVFGRGVSLSSMSESSSTAMTASGHDTHRVSEGRHRVSVASQTTLTNRRMEKIMIRNLKSKREIEELKRMLEEAAATVTELQQRQASSAESGSHNATDSLPAGGAAGGEQTGGIPSLSNVFTWKNNQNKLKGELLLTKMRYEIESLNRQIAYLHQEKEFIAKKAEHKIHELQTSHENELMYQRDLHRNQSTAQQLSLMNERLKDQREHSLELRKIHDEIAFEADRIRHGGLHAEDDDAIEDELLRLRQLRVIQSRQVRELEKKCQIVQDMCDKMQAALRNEQDKNKQLHEHYKLEEVRIFGKEFVEAAAAESQGKGEQDVEGSAAAAAAPQESGDCKQNDGQPAAAQPAPQIEGAVLSKRERSLLVTMSKMEDELKSMQAKYNAEVEKLKYELFKLQQQPASKLITSAKDPMEIEFDQEQKIERMESELARLKRANAYLRKRSIVFDEINAQRDRAGFQLGEEVLSDDESDDGEDDERSRRSSRRSTVTALLPSPTIGDQQAMDERYAQMVGDLEDIAKTIPESKKNTIDRMSKNMWKIISDVAILQQRIRKSRTTIEALDRKYQECEAERLNNMARHEQEIEKLMSEHKIAFDQLRQEHSKERASLQVKLQLLEEHLREARDEVLDGPFHSSKMFELAILEDERRFWNLRQKVKHTQEEIAAYRLREKLWTQLIECQRKNIECTEQLANAGSYEEAMEINNKKEALDMEVTDLVQQLQTLTQQHQNRVAQTFSSSSDAAVEESEEDAIDNAVKEATALVQRQLNQVNKRLEEVMKQREHDADRVRELEFQMRDLQLELEKEKFSKKTIHKEYRNILRQKAEAVTALNDLREQERVRVAALQTQLAELEQQIEEMTEHPESWGLKQESHSTPTNSGVAEENIGRNQLAAFQNLVEPFSLDVTTEELLIESEGSVEDPVAQLDDREVVPEEKTDESDVTQDDVVLHQDLETKQEEKEDIENDVGDATTTTTSSSSSSSESTASVKSHDEFEAQSAPGIAPSPVVSRSESGRSASTATVTDDEKRIASDNHPDQDIEESALDIVDDGFEVGL